MTKDQTIIEMSNEIVKNALQKEMFPDSPALMDDHYHRCVFCGSDNLDSAKEDKIIKPVEHDENCIYLTALNNQKAQS
tara:strand:+ start:375 stop:608 length:234 start_codon:yes stop_codon:yes gene_type:complete